METEEIKIIMKSASDKIDVIEHPERYGLTANDIYDYGIRGEEIKPGLYFYWREEAEK